MLSETDRLLRVENIFPALSKVKTRKTELALQPTNFLHNFTNNLLAPLDTSNPSNKDDSPCHLASHLHTLIHHNFPNDNIKPTRGFILKSHPTTVAVLSSRLIHKTTLLGAQHQEKTHAHTYTCESFFLRQNRCPSPHHTISSRWSSGGGRTGSASTHARSRERTVETPSRPVSGINIPGDSIVINVIFGFSGVARVFL